jgi:CheY-like chemotaxis protein
MMKNRLLYAEDDDVVRSALSQVLRHLGWQVTSAPHGDAALSRIAAAEFDVVVTDHNMPGTDGLALVKNLRARGFAGRIYVISGALLAADEDHYRRLNVDGIASKPVALADLRSMLGAA